jgi:hypothetical protein
MNGKIEVFTLKRPPAFTGIYIKLLLGQDGQEIEK